MTQFEVFTSLPRPGLHIWKPATNLDVFLRPGGARSASGAWVFSCELGVAPLEEVRCQIFGWGDADEQYAWEGKDHIKVVPRDAGGQLPPVVYLFHGAARIVTADPFAQAHDAVTIHLITATRYVDARLYVWGPTVGEPRWIEQSVVPGAAYPVWTVPLADQNRSAFLFKFFRPEGTHWVPEDDTANRVWVAADGAEVWAHSDARDVLAAEPVRQTLRVNFRQEIAGADRPTMRLWGLGSDFSADVEGTDAVAGWTRHEVSLYTGLPYRFKFWNRELPADRGWENREAERNLTFVGTTELWALEGDAFLFSSQPERNCRVEVEVVAQPPGSVVHPPYRVEAWVNRARAPLAVGADLAFDTYPEVLTSFRIHGPDGSERIERHYLRGEAGATVRAFVVPNRPPTLATAPLADVFLDPPFRIKRPGAYEEDGQVRFVLHAPWCAKVDVQGAWLAPATTLPMRSTRDGTYWWAQVSVADLHAGLLAQGQAAEYHGAHYRFQFNGDPHDTVQDPAAGWVDGSAPDGWSRLVQRSAYVWRSTAWETPSWDWLALYQLHPNRFSSRGPATTGFGRAAWEMTDAAGHLRRLALTAIQLMPVNEVGTSNSWGYDPAFYYAVETSYGGPNGLKAFVDACHENGRAVLVDVIFNHAGTTDNVLWKTAQGTFFDGDTDWGAMVNYDDPRVIHFFEQNLIYLLEEYRVDGVRFDFTRVITRGHIWGEAHVKQPGSGGGWEFLHRLRSAMRGANPRALLIAEHLPNEWEIVNFGGSMDSEWCDDFHDALKEVSAGNLGELPKLANALKLTHTSADNWYKATNYAESHDEVGNENGRIANVGGLGRGLRVGKVALCVTLLSRGLPMLFMGEEAGEFRQFNQGVSDTLDLASYASDLQRQRLQDWTNVLVELRKGNASIQGPSPLSVAYAQDGQLAFVRGQAGDYFVLVNFTGWAGRKRLIDLNLPDGVYRERWNSTWPAFQVEMEDEHANGGRDARLHRGHELNVPDYGAVVLERV